MPFKGQISTQKHCAILDKPHSFFCLLMQITGNISYNGTALAEFLPQRTAAYIEQVDLHLPELTVRETMDFAARVQGVGHKAGRSVPSLPPVVQLQNPSKRRSFQAAHAEGGCQLSCWCVRAEELAELRTAEAAAGRQPDPLTDPLLDAETVQGKRESIMTDYMLKLLGLDVSSKYCAVFCLMNVNASPAI